MDDHKDTNENLPGGEHQQDDSSHQHEHGEQDESDAESDEQRVEQDLLEEEAHPAAESETVLDEQHEHAGHEGEGHDHGSHEGHGEGHGGMHKGHEQMFRRRFFVSTLLSIPVLLYSEMLQEWLGFSVPAFPGSEWINPVFAVIVFAYGGMPFLQMAVPELKDRSPGMMTLISMAITVAFVYSLASVVFPTQSAFFWELVTLIDIMLLGHWIEMRSVRRASSAVDELAKLMPDTAERITDGGDTEEVPVSELSEGDLVLVRPGASVPADGVVEEGDSDVNESMITGESKPVSKDPGDEVIGGTINGDGSLRVRVGATGEETTLAGIMRLVEEAQQSKSKTQVLADRAAGWLFYVALAAAVVTAIAWTLAVSFDATVIERVVTVLVIACPHALGLAIPLVVAINTSLAARNGMLVRDRIAMEEARNLDAIIFDKTGTLTEGEHGVVDMATVEGVEEDDALALAAAVESDSEHMIARAIREAADEQDLTAPDATDFEAIKGRGVRANVDGNEVYVGGPNLLTQLDSEIPDHLRRFADEAGQNAQTVVYLVREGELIAAFAMADVIREESFRVVDTLHDLGIEVAMLTGDSQDVANAVADELGIDTVFAEVLPEDKDEKVQELQDQGKLVGMVGDGVNDAPALTRADVGIAIGSGTDVAVQSADVILVQNNPMDVVRLVKLSKASYRKMQENIVWAAGYNVFAIPLAAGVLAPIGILLSPAVGALLMSLSTVIVAINAQLLRRVDLSIPELPSGTPATDAQPAD
ncbi:copper-transporting ATPase CopA (plasmid) [Haloarcula marismortui ATCC 43049]|uniref:Copper-translocating P-type ATPase n=4 Tax=Halobacteriales TaxID=2235 RepID=Q5V6Y2_HALMA|nr:copper-translocating P-type ATPase [Haloarcula marismortui]AAV44608.1 copper-transporting ATPase CopA [Haloarcula marismortui ATCC 43049]QCP89484.1 copper-translocating P-type ATPase [Haloarcula marismortui ATCC 43049]